MSKEKLTKEEKLKRKEYFKIIKKYTKELIRLAKAAGDNPFGTEPGLDMFICFLHYMRDYYKNGYNVWAMERKDENPIKYKDMPTRLESLQMAIDEYDAWENCEDKYQKYHETGGIENGKGITIDGVPQDWWFETLLPDKEENFKACIKEKKQHFKKFFEIVMKYFDEWSD